MNCWFVCFQAEGRIYAKKEDALKVAKKIFGARFKVFSSYPEALEYAQQPADVIIVPKEVPKDKKVNTVRQCRACLFSKSSLARLQEFWNASMCLYEIKRKNLFKSTCPTGSLTCPGLSGSGKRRALQCTWYFMVMFSQVLMINIPWMAFIGDP